MRTARGTALVGVLVVFSACDTFTPQSEHSTTRVPVVQPPLPGGGFVPQANIGVQMTIAMCPCPTSGGNVSLVRTDITTRDSLVLALTRTGMGFIVTRHLADGWYDVTYVPPEGYVTEIPTQTVIVTDAFQWVVFDITQLPPPPSARAALP
jgi:hypothetical protein